MTLAPGAIAWFDVMTFGAKSPWSHSYRKWVSKHWALILEGKFCETSIFNGEGVGDAHENCLFVCLFVFYGPVNNEVMSPLKIWFKEQRKKQQCDAFEKSLRRVQFTVVMLHCVNYFKNVLLFLCYLCILYAL